MLGLIGGLIVGVAYSSSQLLPVLAALAPGRLVPRFLVGLLGCFLLTFTWGMYAPWSFAGFGVAQYTIVFGVALLIARLGRVRIWRRDWGRVPIEPLRITTIDLLVLPAALAGLFTVVGLIDRSFPMDDAVATALASVQNADYVATWFVSFCLEYLSIAPLIWAVFLRQSRKGRIVAILASLLVYYAFRCLGTWGWQWWNGAAIPTGTVWGVLLHQGIGVLATLVVMVGVRRVLRWSGYHLVRRRA